MPVAKGMRSGPHPLAIAVFAFAAALSALVAIIAVFGKASDGDPIVSLVLAPPPEMPAAQESAAPRGPEIPGAETQNLQTQNALTESRFVNGNLVADPELLERTPEGQLPIAANGRTPMAAYARPFNRADQRPRIALVIGGLGISADATKLALDHLPPGVTLSFAPYASGVQRWIDAARGAGHEVLLEVPMEPLSIPKSGPGPHTLLVAASPAQNLQHLDWALSRFTGYVGATNLLGGRFLAEMGALRPVLAEVAKRGLLFFDNGASAHSVSAETAKAAGAPMVTGTIVLDGVPSHEAILAKLSELEQQARTNGTAVASGFLYPVTIQQVADWAKSLERRGLVLAPLTATVVHDEGTPPQ
jgi:polysaccharide deacetylase 2 family uncharacterized protein YibQ